MAEETKPKKNAGNRVARWHKKALDEARTSLPQHIIRTLTSAFSENGDSYLELLLTRSNDTDSIQTVLIEVVRNEPGEPYYGVYKCDLLFHLP